MRSQTGFSSKLYKLGAWNEFRYLHSDILSLLCLYHSTLKANTVKEPLDIYAVDLLTECNWSSLVQCPGFVLATDGFRQASCCTSFPPMSVGRTGNFVQHILLYYCMHVIFDYLFSLFLNTHSLHKLCIIQLFIPYIYLTPGLDWQKGYSILLSYHITICIYQYWHEFAKIPVQCGSYCQKYPYMPALERSPKNLIFFLSKLVML